MANVNVGGVYATFRAQNRQFLRATRENVAALRRTRTGMRETSRSVSAFRNVALRSVGAVTAFAASLAGVNAILRGGLAIDTSFTRLETLVGLSADEVRRLRTELQGVAETEGLNLQELSDGAFFLASAGVEAQNVGEVITAAGKAAALGLGTIDKVAEALTTSLGAWGAAAEDAETETAILVATARLGRFPVEQFARQWSRVAGLAPSIGITSREVSALLATLSRTLNLEQSATSLRTLFAQLNQPPEKAVGVFKQIGVSVDDIRKSLSERGLLATLIQLEEQLEAVGLSFKDVFRSQEAATAISVLSVDDWALARELLEDVNKVVGEDLNNSFLKLKDSVSGQFNQSLNTLQAYLQRIAQVVLPPLVRGFALVVENLDKLRYAAFLLAGVLFRRLVLSNAAAAALLFAKGLLTASGAMAALTAATNFFRAALIRIGFGILIVAIGEAVYQIIRFTNAMGGVGNAFQAALAVGREAFERIKFNFELLLIDFELIFLRGRLLFVNFVKALPEIAIGSVRNVVALFKSGLNAIRILWEAAPDFFKGVFDKVKTFASEVVNDISRKFGEFLNFLGSFLGLQPIELPEIEVPEVDIRGKIEEAILDAERYLRGGLEIIKKDIRDAFDPDQIREAINDAYFQREIALLSEAERRTAFETILDRFRAVGVEAEDAANEVKQLRKDIESFNVGEGQVDIDVGGNVTEVAEELDERGKNLQRLAGDIGNAFGDFTTETIKNFRNIGEAARQLGQTILDSLIKRLIASPITSAITNSLSSLFGVPGLQNGGLGRGLTLVGEGGPELVDFRRPGRVYSNADLSRALESGGGGNTFNFAPVINSNDPAAVNRALAEAYPIFESRVLSTIQLDARRRSGLRQSLRG